MCTDLTLDQEASFGRLVQLCDRYPICNQLRVWLDWQVAPTDKSQARRGAPPLSPDPFAPNMLAAFAASVAIIEPSYFDVDFRSEFKVIQETSFTTVGPDVRRVHFFKHKQPEGDLVSLRAFVHDVAQACKDITDPADSHYRGYMVIRSTQPPTIGRALVPPFEPVSPPGERGWDDSMSKTRSGPAAVSLLGESDSLAKHVRTAVYEPVQLFGVGLPAYGVPFMEQDGALLRCSHVTAWMAHYTAVLHGLVPRRTSAAFSSAGDPSRSYGRAYPSQGLTSLMQSQMLSSFDLPPEVLYTSQLCKPRGIRWHDREALAHAVERAAAPPASADPRVGDVKGEPRLEGAFHLDANAPTDAIEACETTECSQSGSVAPTGPASKEPTSEHALEGIWLAENFTSSVARYLNSGFPVILNYGDHSYLVCGYLREGREVDKSPISPGGGRLDPDIFGLRKMDVSMLIVQDDQMGPYRTLDVRQLVAAAARDPFPVVGVVPLPSGLWLSGAAAELGAAKLLRWLVPERYERLQKRALKYTPEEFEEMRRLTQGLSNAMAEPYLDRNYAIRSYAIGSGDFRRSFSKRVGDQLAGNLVSSVPLPKYVWVVEILDRRERMKFERKQNGQHSNAIDVIATVVLDGSAVSDEGVARPPDPLLVHLPGQIIYTSAGRIVKREKSWVETAVGLYQTGRWSQSSSGFNNPVEFMMRAKTALAHSW